MRWSRPLFASVWVVAACCSVAPKKEPLLPTVQPLPPACRLDPPPTWEPLAADLGGNAACPPAYTACLPPEGAVTLMRNVRRLQEWSADAMARCGTAQRAEAPSK